ncbi:hypothetical protein NVS55_08585 [Myxococcus stipitatus]|uniref:hypothetical protein n=1 Tax=Myxococcus stipitatus TaxID=83455 RepID=UPI00314515BC
MLDSPTPARTRPSHSRRRAPTLALIATLWLASSSCASQQAVPTTPAPAATRVKAGRTNWALRPSEAFDALCLLNLLRGDAFYTRFYPAEFERFSALLQPQEKAALDHLTERLGKQAGKMVGPQLVLVFSVANPTTVDSLARTVSDDDAWEAMRRAFKATSYGEKSDYSEMEDVRQDLGVLFAFLQRIDFPRIWRAEYLPQVEQSITQLAAQVAPHDVVGWDEDILGRALHVEELNAHVLKFVKPHGIRVTGWNFLTDLTYPVSVTVKTAVHELLHPPFKREGLIDERLTALEADPYFQRLVREHDPAFGYTTARGLTEEDCAEAIDVFVTERQGLLRTKDGKPRTGAEFFRDHDDGIHVLAYILYEELRRAELPPGTKYEDFILKLFDTGVLVPGKFEERFRSYPGAYRVKSLKE